MSFWCKWFGHRWLDDGWWKLDGGQWRRHRTCRRCLQEETWTTNTKLKPLNIGR